MNLASNAARWVESLAGRAGDDPSLTMTSLAAAVAAALLALALGRLFAETPEADRRWNDRPPGWWRICWPLVPVVARLLLPAMPRRSHRAIGTRLRRAGLDLALTPEEFVAGRVVAALGCGVAAAAYGILVGLDGGFVRWIVAFGGLMGWVLPGTWLRERAQRRIRALGRSLPFFLDLVTLSVEAGSNLTGALALAVERGPGGPLRDELQRVLRDVSAGRARADALGALAERLELASVSAWVAAMVAAERSGSGLVPILRAQAEQRREERFQQAEKLAMQAPVKMLFPLLVFIFPCTFVLLFFPIVVRLLEEGVLR